MRGWGSGCQLGPRVAANGSWSHTECWLCFRLFCRGSGSHRVPEDCGFLLAVRKESSSPCLGLLANCLLTPSSSLLNCFMPGSRNLNVHPDSRATMQFKRIRRVITGSMETKQFFTSKEPIISRILFSFLYMHLY